MWSLAGSRSPHTGSRGAATSRGAAPCWPPPPTPALPPACARSGSTSALPRPAVLKHIKPTIIHCIPTIYKLNRHRTAYQIRILKTPGTLFRLAHAQVPFCSEHGVSVSVLYQTSCVSNGRKMSILCSGHHMLAITCATCAQLILGHNTKGMCHMRTRVNVKSPPILHRGKLAINQNII